jgi:predicted transcriptional regulator
MRTRPVMLFLLVLGALALLAVAASAQTPPPASGDWVITNDFTSYTGTRLTVNGNITVGYLGYLSLQDVELVINSSVPATITVESASLGCLLQNSNVTASDQGYTVVLFDQGYLVNTTFSGLVSIEVRDFHPIVTQCTLLNPSGVGIYFNPYMSSKMQPTTISYNRIIGYQDMGIEVVLASLPAGALNVLMNGNHITGSGGFGINAFIEDGSSGELNLTGTVVDGSTEVGIYVQSGGARVAFSDVDVSGATMAGIEVYYSRTPPGGQVIRGVRSVGNGLGVQLDGDKASLWQRPRLVGWNVSGNSEYGLFMANIYCATLEDSTVVNGPTATWYDIQVVDGTLDVYRTELSTDQGRPLVSAEAGYSHASIRYWSTVRLTATWQNGVPVTGMRMDIIDDTGEVAATAVTDSLGVVGPLDVWAWSAWDFKLSVRGNLTALLVWGGGRLPSREGALAFDGPVDAAVVFVDDVVPTFVGFEGTFGIWTNETTYSTSVVCVDDLSGIALVQASMDPEPDWDLKAWTDAVFDGERYHVTFPGLAEGTYQDVPYWRAYDVASYPGGPYCQTSERGWLYIDLTPPSVTISSPVSGLSEPYYTNKLYIDINGTVEDDVGVEVVRVDGLTVEPVDGSFSHRVPLFEGENVFTVTVQDKAGNLGQSVLVRVVLDTVEPLLVVLGPPEGTRTRSAWMEVNGLTDLDVTRVVVAGVPATLDGEDWAANVTLARGLNDLLVEAFDRAGNRNWATVTVRMDDLAPRVSIESPARGALLGTPWVELTCFIEEEDLLVKVTINGVEYPFDSSPGLGAGFNDEPIGPFTEGEATIVVEATDISGNVGRMTVVVTIDTTPPTLTELSVANGTATNQRHLPLTGRTEWDATLLLGGRDVAVESGAFSTTLDLREGWNTVTLDVTDLAGNTDSVVLHVLLDTVPPQLIIDFVTGPEVTVRGDVYEVRGLTEPFAQLVVEVGGVPYNVTVNADGTFSRVVAMLSSRTAVNITATDHVGNANMTMLMLVRAVPAPSTPWTESPAAVGGAAAVSVLIVLGVAASIETTKYSLLLLIIPLYARIKKDAVLDNKTRYALHGLIIENPGLHYNAVIREFGLTNGEAAYHLSVLEREGFIRSVRDGTLRKFYSTTSKIPSSKRMTPEEMRERILDLVDGLPGISQKQIVDELGIGRTLAGYHIKGLLVEGFLEARHEGRFTVYYPTRKKREGIAQRVPDPQAGNGWDMRT